MGDLTQSTAEVFEIKLVSDVDGITAVTGLGATPTLTISKNGAAFAAKDAGSSVAELATGYYAVTLSATDTNTLGNLGIKVVGTGAMEYHERFRVRVAPGDVFKISGDATAADNLEAMLDGTGGVDLTLRRCTLNSDSELGTISIGNTQMASATAAAVQVSSTSGPAFGLTEGAAATSWWKSIRNAFKLAPTAGAPATDSLDKHLDDIIAKTNTIGSVNITVSSIVDGSEINIVAGADHTSTRGFTVAYTGHDLTAVGTTARFRLVSQSNFNRKVDDSTAEGTATITTTDANSGTIACTLTAAQSLLLTPGSSGHEYRYQVQIIPPAPANPWVIAAGWANCTLFHDAVPA